MEGTALGVLPDKLLRAVVSREYRPAIQRGDLLLISPFDPEAGFNVGNAMARNKYIYCLADTAIVVCSGTSGGTWTGAVENLKREWVPLWAGRSNESESVNAKLVELGARWLPDPLGSLDSVLEARAARPTSAPDTPPTPADVPTDLYAVFSSRLLRFLEGQDSSATQIAKAFELKKGQCDAWLGRAVAEGLVEKKGKPGRYRKAGQISMFES